MVPSSHAATLSGKARPSLAGVPIVARGQLCEVNQKLTLASAERARIEFSSRGAAWTASLLRKQGAVVMRRISIVGLCLAAVCVFSAGAVSSASAAELLARPAGGGSIAGVSFLGSVVLPLLLTVGGGFIHCKDALTHGLFLNSTLGNILIQFLGCSTVSALKCQTGGAAVGEIHLPLSTIFHIGLAHLTISVGRIPAAVVLAGVINIECEAGIKIEVKGNVIGAFQKNGTAVPLNTPFLDINLNFQQTSAGTQHLRLFLLPGTTGLSTYDLSSSTNEAAPELASEVANALLDGFKLPGATGKEDDIEFIEP
jgi:hypothetical protein